jgi:lysophospholipase L1-like esterase
MGEPRSFGHRSVGRRVARVCGRLLLVFLAIEASLRGGASLVARFVAPSRACDGSIACVGDSNTFGVGATNGRSYPDQLQGLLRDAGSSRRVVNLAFPGLKSTLALDRLERQLGEATPSCVLFLAGVNDRLYDYRLESRPACPPSDETNGCSLLAGLRHCMTWRVGEAAIALLRGDVARADLGGQSDEEIDPDALDLRDWDCGYPAARRRGANAIFPWLVKAWSEEQPELATVAWHDLAALPGFDELVHRLLLPRAAYEWELAWLLGQPAEPLAPRGLSGFAREYASLTLACADLERGNVAHAHELLAASAARGDPCWREFAKLHAAWVLLLERRFDEAATVLTRNLDEMPPVAEPVARSGTIAGAVLASALSRDPGTLGRFKDAHERLLRECCTPRQSRWTQEWLAVAKLVETQRRGDERGRERALAEVKQHLDPPTSRPLRWLLEHPEASAQTVLAELPLEPVRASWIGPRLYFREPLGGEELERRLAASFERLARLQERHGFRVVVLTYLNYERAEPNGCLHKLAAKHQWPLVDLPARYGSHELGRDDKRRYFAADRAHPNEEGYGLMARGVFEKLQVEGLAR